MRPVRRETAVPEATTRFDRARPVMSISIVGVRALNARVARMSKSFESVQEVRDGLKKVNYLADDGIASVVYLAQRLGKPILVEGPAGTGKTQLAKSAYKYFHERLYA